MILNTIAVANGKGGVGKTSITANVAGLLAQSGWRTLIVDLDPQGDLAHDLGYFDDSDDGRALFEAVLADRPVAPRHDVRPNLDVIVGGDDLTRLEDLLATDRERGRYSVERSLAPVLTDYQIVFIDCPPAVKTATVRVALGIARFVVIPTRADKASIAGLGQLAQAVGDVAADANPDIEVLGVALFGVGASHHAIRRRARSELEELLGVIAPVFDTPIRDAQLAAQDLRANGLLAHEYEAEALAALPYHEALRTGQEVARYASNAGGLAADYEALTNEIVALYLERRDDLPTSADNAEVPA